MINYPKTHYYSTRKTIFTVLRSNGLCININLNVQRICMAIFISGALQDALKKHNVPKRF